MHYEMLKFARSYSSRLISCKSDGFKEGISPLSVMSLSKLLVRIAAIAVPVGYQVFWIFILHAANPAVAIVFHTLSYAPHGGSALWESPREHAIGSSRAFALCLLKFPMERFPRGMLWAFLSWLWDLLYRCTFLFHRTRKTEQTDLKRIDKFPVTPNTTKGSLFAWRRTYPRKTNISYCLT